MTTNEMRQYLDALDEGKLEWVSMTGNRYRVGDVDHMMRVLKSSDERLVIKQPEKEYWLAIKAAWAVLAEDKDHASYPDKEPILDLCRITYNPNTRTATIEVVGKETP